MEISEPPSEPPANLFYFPLAVGEHRKSETNLNKSNGDSKAEGNMRLISYKNMVTRELDESMHEEDDTEEQEVEENFHFNLEGMKVEKCMEGDYECPEFVLFA